MSEQEPQTEEKLRRQIELWRDNFINTSIRKNNLLNQSPAVSDAILFETSESFTYDIFWDIACGRKVGEEKLAEYALWSGNDYADRRLVPPIGWHAERTGERDLALLDAIIDGGYRAVVQKGENPVCLSFGKLDWYVEKTSDAEGDCGEVIVKEIDGKAKEFVRISSPLLLIPVKLNNIGTNYWLRPVEEDAVFNPALILRFRREGYKLFPHPGIIDKDTFDIKAYFGELEQHFEGNDGFRFDKTYVALDKFDYDRICMYRDVQKHIDEIAENKILRAFFGGKLPVAHEIGDLDTLDPLRSHQILDSDTSQNTLIERFAQGESLILQGPPGTGKTQTIVNMIAEAVMRGKRVLFVSSKMSALDTALKKLRLMPNVNIDKHCLLIRGEEENKTLDVGELYGNLQKSLNAPRAELDMGAYRETARVLTRSRDLLLGYNREFYDRNNSLQMSVYDIIGRMLLLGYNENFILPVELPPSDLHALTRERLAERTGKMGELEKVLLGMIRRFGSVERDVWYGYLKFSVERTDEETLRRKAEEVRHTLDEIEPFQEELGELPLAAVRAISAESTVEEFLALCKRPELGEEKRLVEEEIERSATYRDALERYHVAHPALDYVDDEALVWHRNTAGFKVADPRRTLGEIAAEYKRISAVPESLLRLHSPYGAGEPTEAELSALAEYLQDYATETKRRAALERAILEHYEAPILEFDCRALLGKFRTAWAENVKCGRAPLFFRLHIRGILRLCRDVEHADLTVGGVYRLLEQLAAYDEAGARAKDLLKNVQSYGIGEMTAELAGELAWLIDGFLGEKRSSAVSFRDSVGIKRHGMLRLLDTATQLRIGKEVTVEGLRGIIADCITVRKESARIAQNTDLSRILPSLQHGAETDFDEILALLKSAEQLHARCSNGTGAEECDERIARTVHTLASGSLSAAICKLIEQYRSFYKTEAWFGENALAFHPYARMTYGDFCDWLGEAENIDRLTEYAAYKRHVRETEGTPEGDFFRRYAAQGRANFPIEKLRDHYEMSLLYAYYAELIRTSRYVSYLSGLDGVHTVRAQTEEFVAADRALCTFARAAVDRKLYDGITRGGSLHNYLASVPKGANVSVRRLLKTRSESIRELAPCLMMSVYSVSKLLAYEQYKFDVVIFDEASQIPTEDALTSIMRTDKQIVIAGDPKQMPAISYFESKEAPLPTDDDEDETVSCESIIDFALNARQNAIGSSMLRMHYRSNHESLIKYSNEHPNLYGGRLVTFPSPFARSEDFGLWDYSLSDDPAYAGKLTGGGGENMSEAEVTVGLVRRHFERYPLPNTEEETERYHSLGVIVFGSRQKKLILGMMEKDDLLRTVVARRDPRIFTISTADEIQGDEMSEMVLSLTYGRDKEGKITQSWGHMNKKDVALRKFNVAVTRARDNLKFVHSVNSPDVTSDRLDYIADYLRELGEKAAPFVGDPSANTDFVRAIGKICESVVGAERVVYNFGESKNSYRVPVSILSPDRTRVVLGIMCEENRGYEEGNGEKRGFSVREYSRICPDILRRHGWDNLYETYAIQWIRNYRVERAELLRRLDSVK